MDLDNILQELEQKGIRNDEAQSNKALKYLNITRDTGEFLRVLVLATRSSKILEVGTSNGYSTLWLASSIPPNGTVTTVEYSRRKAKEALSNFERSGLAHKIELLQGEAQAVLKDLRDQYDLIFLDADRSTYMDMVQDISRLLKSGGLIVCDNAISHESELAEFTSYLRSHQHFTTALVQVGKGEFLAHKLGNKNMSIETSYNFRKIHDRLTTSGTVQPESLKTLVVQGYEVIINLMPDESEYAVADERKIVESQKLEYIYIPVYFKHPKKSDFVEFSEALDRVSERKIHIHCAANYRVSAFYAMYATINGYWSLGRAWKFIHDVWQPAEYPGWSEFITDVLNMRPAAQQNS